MGSLNLYRRLIIDHYKNPHNFGKMEKPDYRARVFNSFCGDVLEIDFRIKREDGEEVIEEAKFSGNGCAISIASASLLTDYLKKKKLKDILKIGKEEMLKILGVEISPLRLKCALLPLEVLKAIGRGFKKRGKTK